MKTQFEVWRFNSENMYSVPISALFGKRGRVTAARRNAIRDKVRDLFLLAERD